MIDQPSSRDDTNLSSAPVPRGSSVVRLTLQIVLLLLVVAVSLWVLYRLAGILILLVLAGFFAYLVAPLVKILHRPVTFQGRKRTLPLPAAIGLVYLLILTSVAVLILLLLPVLEKELGDLAKEAPGYISRAQLRWQTWQREYQQSALPRGLRDAIDHAVQRTLPAAGTFLTTEILGRIAASLTYLPWLVIVPIFAFFLLKDSELFRQSALRVFPRGRWRSRGDSLLVQINDTLAAYIRAQVLACLFIGVTCTIGFLVIGVPYAFVIGVAAGFLEFIPLAGPLTIGFVAVVLSAFHSGGQALAVALFLIVLRLVQDYVVYPKIVGRGIHLHPMAIILTILCGAELAGLAGVFLAIPVLAVLTVLYRDWRQHRAVLSESLPE